MRNSAIAMAVAASVTLSACVQTRQYADLQFSPPAGDYKLLVLRPDVSVGSVTTGGMVEPRADWTEQARANITAALKAQQAGRGGQVLVAERRNEIPNVDADTVAEVERLNFIVAQSIVLHKYLGVYLPTKRGKGLEYTLGREAVEFGRKTGFDYMLFLHAEDSFASTGRVVLQVIGIAGCFGRKSEGLKLSRGKGIHFNGFLPHKLDRIDSLSAALDSCVRVKVAKV